jgi:short-subunit dehydrogenase
VTWRRALVTGASSGIGEALARLLAAQGTSVVAVARREDRLRQLPGDVEVLVADLTDPDGLTRVEARLAVGDVDLLVNNAGFGTGAPLAEIPADRVAAEVALDVVALTRLTRAALPSMLRRGGGGILNVSSVVAFLPTPGMATYSGSKAYVNAFTESVAAEVAAQGVAVTALCPGHTRTEFQGVAHEGQPRRLPGWAWQSAEDVAAAGLAGLAAGRRVVVPGAVNKVLVLAASTAPRPLVRGAIAVVQRRRAYPPHP